ncbi:MAG: sulfotransferase family 2 domain-containing protein, partial [Pseudomonadota bacterium]
MLISHNKKFIFTKTIKTASTSTEAYFERYCMPAGEWQPQHLRDEHVSSSGIIGYRGLDPSAAQWRNHMPAKEIKERIGDSIWSEYFKFTTIRNPYDKLVSHYYALRRHGQVPYIDDHISGFRKWLESSNLLYDADKYKIDGYVSIDFFIRFENLIEDIAHVCNNLSIEFSEEDLPRLKADRRPQIYHLREFFDDEAQARVSERYAWEISNFGYRLSRYP